MSHNGSHPGEQQARPVLAAIDGSPISYQAAAWAAAEAAVHRRPLHLVTSALPPRSAPVSSASGADFAHWRVHAERVVDEAARVARNAVIDHLPVTTEVAFEAVVPLLIERSVTAEMLVVGSHGSGGLHRGTLGPTTSAVTGHAKCPVAVVHGVTAADPVSLVRPVLVGVDGTPDSVPAVELAFDEASRRRVDLVAMHAFDDVDGPLTLGREMTIGTAEAELSEALAGYGERYPEVTVRTTVVANRATRSLLRASMTAQLLVVGSHGRGGFIGMLLGSTSAALLRAVEIPMIVVRGGQAAEPRRPISR
ncbi:universal stress protein [Nocardia asteroides]|uniref:universal stress protein n=1 Tax=Nocardia asteroides TaxID=1824 RepID=UPI003650D0F5